MSSPRFRAGVTGWRATGMLAWTVVKKKGERKDIVVAEE